MAIDGLTPAVVFPLFNFVLRGVQTAYELASVPAETGDYLKTISQVMADLKITKQLRRQKSKYLSYGDLVEVDRTINNTEEAMKGVEVLVESARVDMSTSPGSVSARSRIMWIIRDQTKIGAAMNRLAIASQSLQREIIVLKATQTVNTKYEYEDCKYDYGYDDMKSSFSSPSSSSSDGWQQNPPTYLQATIDAIHERRKWNERRNSTAKKRPASRNTTPTSATVPTGFPSFPAFNDTCDDAGLMSASMNNVAEWIRHNEDILSVLAPGASAEPRDKLLPATIVNMPDDLGTWDTISELDGDIPPSMARPLRPASASPFRAPPIVPPLRTASRVNPSFPQQQRGQTMSLPNLASQNWAAHDTSKSQRRPPPVPPKKPLTTLGPSLMESTTLIPGRRTPMRVRWKEDTGDEIHVIESYADEREAGVHEYFPPSPENPFNDSNEPSVNLSDSSETDKPAEQPLRRTKTRIRPPRVQGNLNYNVSMSDVSQTSEIPKKAHSRSGSSSQLHWRLQMQNEDLARLGN
ncbi:hypothetical protein H2198_002578 [Neophaeococcomyces mojaviensis]|uniref:Uncharacterized protein n=1 Tax=Neophaeococcomyces mojaviensis TaxID=3383035 RepID=A0ACC3AEG8_9EURO|nr:hypothetical protein H2198_002578 [Knufia sp. JES_112]